MDYAKDFIESSSSEYNSSTWSEWERWGRREQKPEHPSHQNSRSVQWKHLEISSPERSAMPERLHWKSKKEWERPGSDSTVHQSLAMRSIQVKDEWGLRGALNPNLETSLKNQEFEDTDEDQFSIRRSSFICSFEWLLLQQTKTLQTTFLNSIRSHQTDAQNYDLQVSKIQLKLVRR